MSINVICVDDDCDCGGDGERNDYWKHFRLFDSIYTVDHMS